MDHDTFREWLDLEVDGALDEAERGRLEAHLVSCPDCREERRLLAALAGRLAADRVPVRAGFAARVMDALGPAPWESRAPRAWGWPLALVVALAASAAILSAAAGGDPDPAGRWWGALGAVAGLFEAALSAGSGLAAATWTGVGAAIAEWLGRSPANWVAAAVLVVGLDLLALRLVRARGRVAVRRPSPPPR